MPPKPRQAGADTGVGFLSPFPPSVTLKTDAESSLNLPQPHPQLLNAAELGVSSHSPFLCDPKDSHTLSFGLVKATCAGPGALLCPAVPTAPGVPWELAEGVGHLQCCPWHSGSLKMRQKLILATTRPFPGFKAFCIFSNKPFVFAFLPLFFLCSSSQAFWVLFSHLCSLGIPKLEFFCSLSCEAAPPEAGLGLSWLRQEQSERQERARQDLCRSRVLSSNQVKFTKISQQAKLLQVCKWHCQSARQGWESPCPPGRGHRGNCPG